MTILLTGATGLVGSEILQLLVRRGDAVIAVVRRRGRLRAADRLLRLLASMGVEHLASLVTVLDADAPGSLTDKLRDLDPIDATLHAAASVEFDRPLAVLARDNVEATADLLDAVDSVAPDADFHLVSTAYVAAIADAPVPEGPTMTRRFRNAYEESKAMAEDLVVRRCDAVGRAWSILRPSIVAGRSACGSAASFRGLASLLRLFDLVARGGWGPHLERQPAFIHCRAAASKNVVPVDWVAACAVEVISRGARREHLHLTHPSPVGHVELLEHLLDVVDIRGVELHGGRPGSVESTPMQRLFDRSLERYDAYLWGEPAFDRRVLESSLPTHAEPPAVDRDYVRRLIEYGRSVGWRSNPFESSTEREPLVVAPSNPGAPREIH